MKYLSLLLLLVTGSVWGAADTTLHCTTNPCETITTPPPPPADAATGRFVDCSATLNGNGLGGSQATSTGGLGAWNNIPSVNGATIPTSVDVWFKAGTTCNLTVPLTIDWGGTAADPAVIGSYYLSSGQPIIDQPTNDSNSIRPRNYTYPQPRAKLRGTYNDQCRNSATYFGNVPHPDPNKCAWGGNGTLNNLPTNQGAPVPSLNTGGLVQMTLTGRQYVIVQDLDLRDSAGQGISVNTTQHPCLSSNALCQAKSIVQRVYIKGAAGTTIALQDVGQIVVRKSETMNNDIAQADSEYGVGNGGVAGGVSINVSNCNPCQVLIEQNDTHDGWGESMGMYGVAGVLVRGNESSAHVRAGIDGGAGSHQVTEQNISADGGPINDARAIALGATYSGARGRGTLDYEDRSSSGSPVGPSLFPPYRNGYLTVRRNNAIIAPEHSCLGGYTTASPVSWLRVHNLDYGNTCFYDTSSDTHVGWRFDNVATSDVDVLGMNVVNNLFVKTGSGTAVNCSVGVFTASKFNFRNNYWAVAPTSASCKSPGTGDKYGGTTGLGAFDFANVIWASNWPTAAQIKPSTSGVGNNAGTGLLTQQIPTDYVDLNGTVVLANMWTWVLSQRQWLPTCNTTGVQVSETNWKLGLYADYCSNPRGSSPDLGFIEY